MGDKEPQTITEMPKDPKNFPWAETAFYCLEAIKSLTHAKYASEAGARTIAALTDAAIRLTEMSAKF